MMKKEEEQKKEQGPLYEGRDRYWMDIDRMVNDGMAGGIVAPYTGISELPPLREESPPTVEKDDD